MFDFWFEVIMLTRSSLQAVSSRKHKEQ